MHEENKRKGRHRDAVSLFSMLSEEHRKLSNGVIRE